MNFASEYAFQTLLYISRMVSEGDYKTPEKMGMNHSQMALISDLTTQDIHTLSALTQANFVSVEFDRKALDLALTIIIEKNKRQKEIYELLKEGASYPVMKYIYGLTLGDMATCRKVLKLSKCDGRPPLPQEEEKHKLWAYITPGDLKETETLAQKLLFVSRETGMKINIIWAVLNQWLKELPGYE